MPITRGPRAIKKREEKGPVAKRFALHCVHCGRNQSRVLRNGRGNWTCKYCEELNPGPALSDKVIAVRKRGQAKGVEPATEGPVGTQPSTPAGSRPSPKRPVRASASGAPKQGAPPRLKAGEGAGRAPSEPAPNVDTGAPAGSGAPPTKPKVSAWDRVLYGS